VLPDAVCRSEVHRVGAARTDRFEPCCIVPLGWPHGRYGPTTRKPVEEVTHLDAYGNRAWLDNT
jgi:hypothetical protein